MSSHVVGIQSPDSAKYKKMKAAWDACVAAKINVPDELYHFFGEDGPPDDCEEGIVVELPEDAVTKYVANMRDGFDIDLSFLPKDIKKIRFYNSY